VSTLTFMESIAQLNAFTVFLAIAAVGFLFLMISLFFGGMLEHFDGALDHDLDHGGPGFFSTRVISVFITAFGGFGAIATHYGFGTLPASLIGALSGVVLATPIYYFARFLYGQQASSDSRAQDLVGQVGRVVIALPVGGVGQVRCKIGEELVDKIARSADMTVIAENTPVVIEEVVGETVVVRRR
jgi:membrane protein implicated in regulation of membrane protease activity